MSKFCCFNCPERDYSEKELSDICPKCGKHYGFPLDEKPKEVGKFTVEKPIARGFYGATYLAVSKEKLPKRRVLKVIPQSIYTFFEKKFELECQEHSKLQNEHIVEIYDYFDEDVDFNGTIIPCHVSVLDYIDGKALEDEMLSDISIERLTQIAIDLLEILQALKNNNKSHNDLHPGNIIVSNLQQGTRRIDQIDNSIKLIIIDLNSASDKTQSSDSRLGDINWIGDTIQKIVKQFIDRKEKNNEKITDKENRVLTHFENYSKLLKQKIENTRIPHYSDLIFDIKNSYIHAADPWNESFSLRSFDYAYNAQTLKPNYVPALFVDPEGKFFKESIKPGPSIIYGMRGCGKTLLLLGLTFYSRISKENNDKYSDLDADGIINRIQDDGFIGLYINANKLLDAVGKNQTTIYKPLERMYLRFSQEALRTLMTLKKIKDNCVSDLYYETIAHEINSKINSIVLNNIKSERELDDWLTKEINILENGSGEEINISTAAPILFENLSTVITNCSEILKNHNILYLLDDLSTRYLSIDNITPLISTFIFQSNKCAFKITTEEQTLNAILLSPGNQEKLRLDRDLQTYNLGNQVNEEIRKNNDFVINILLKRSKCYLESYPKPIELLGDCSLLDIANNITQTGRKKKEKKLFYHGITMLSKVCVGDIGDIIHIYNLMLEKYKSIKKTPLPGEIQNDVYQSVSANKLFDLDRNKNDLKDFAITFAKASYKLLMDSRHTNRLRQYNSINVNITSGNQDFQIERLRSLVDAGIFIYDGSPKSPRTTGNNTNPLLQFKLAFRKLLGLTNFIGITQADRFELSGNELENWLKNPQDGEKILLKNKIIDDSVFEPAVTTSNAFNKAPTSIQGSLFSEMENYKTNHHNNILAFIVEQNTILLDSVKFGDKSLTNYKQYLLGVGFEDRTYESLKKILSVTELETIYAIEHSLKEGKFEDIRQLLVQSGKKIHFIKENEINSIDFNIKTLIDVSGLSKAMIFNSLIETKKEMGNIVVVETEALELSPSDKDLEHIINTSADKQATTVLKEVTEKIESSEIEPYIITRIFNTDTDESNYRVVLCFSSAKFERMLYFLDNKQYDKILIINPVGDDNRSKLARCSSQVIQDKYSSLETEIQNVDITNPNDILKAITELYQKYYIQEGYNFDIALTGSKLQTICASIFTCYNKINNCWYISPKGWKSNSFSSGATDTYLYSLNHV
jgi:serine/threonine protein kinase